MEKIKYLIIGGGVAGTTAAETIRQLDPLGSCTIVSDEPYRMYSRIMLSKPNFFLEKIPFDQIWLKQDDWYQKNTISLITGKKATALDTTKKTVTLNDGTTITYEKLLLAPGSRVRMWDIPGAEKEGIYYLRTLDDAKGIIAKVKSAKRAIVVGGGFVGFEMCEMLHLAGIEVTLIIREPYFWDPILDQRSGARIETILELGGIKILRNSQVKEVVGNATAQGVTLHNNIILPTDMIVVGIGTYCPFAWIQTAGIQVNQGILTNEYLMTNAPDVWAAGDGAEFKDVILDEHIQLGNWANAQMQGRVAARNMCGDETEFRLVSFYVTSGFGITIAFAGDIRPSEGREIIARDTADGISLSRLILKADKIIGATMINNTKELATITKLVEKGTSMKHSKEKLADASFDLKALLETPTQ
ncbi:MAG: FAD-dependent oxidoreductase [Candidatus Azambacteria bacterium]|nr:FAD-dependent oxidoreductase [Candidatus Azambacteria bacterium]